MHKTLLVAAIAIAGLNTAVADEWVVEAHYPDTAALTRAAANFQHVIVDAKRQTLRVDTDEGGIRQLEDAGLTINIDQAATAKLRVFYAQFAQARAAGLGPDSIPGYQCFRTVEETYQTMDTMVTNHPEIVAIDNIGPTWNKTQNAAQGYDMRALRITNLATAASEPNRPKMVVFSSIHAREYAPAELDTRFAEYLVNGYGTDPEATWLVDHNDFRLVLQANPDGRKKAETGISWRKNVDSTNGACSSGPNGSAQPGIDLNRNFPFHWNITQGVGSSGTKCNLTYRGPFKQSEPETDHLVNYVAGTCSATGDCTGGVFADRRSGSMNPVSGTDDGGAAPDDTTGFFVDIHSNAALVLWSWGDTTAAAPNQSALRTLGRRLAYFNGYIPEQSDSLYPTDGTTDDSMYGLLGVPGFTIETNGSDFFEDCATFENSTAPTNIAALRYVARALHAPYKLPAGPDTLDVNVGSDLIVTGDPIIVSARTDDTRFNQYTSPNADQVPGTVRNIGSAAAFVDQLPWDMGASATALAASDGAFDSSVENVSGTVSGATLTTGRHMIYVQGTDAAGNAGTPNAALLDVVDAATVGTLAGRVTDRATNAPMGASIALHNPQNNEAHNAHSDAVNGAYRAHAYPGTFDVHVSAPHHLSEDLLGVPFAAGGSIAHDFALYPNCTILSDDVEAGNQGWTAQTPWVIANNVPGNATHVWGTPSYAKNLNSSLTSATHDLTGYSDVTLDFDDRCDTEGGYDFGYAEFSANGGTSWTQLYVCNGQTAWQSHHVELPASANGAAALKLRFRLTSDGGVNTQYGWSIDNVRVEAGGDACRAQQQPNDIIFDDGFDGV